MERSLQQTPIVRNLQKLQILQQMTNPKQNRVKFVVFFPLPNSLYREESCWGKSCMNSKMKNKGRSNGNATFLLGGVNGNATWLRKKITNFI